MFELVKHQAWLFVIRGLLAIAFGVLAFANPGIALAALVVLYGAFALTDGIVSLVGSFVLAKTKLVWWLLAEGLLGITAGVVALTMPAATAVALLFMIGAWLVVSGVVRIALAIKLSGLLENSGLLAIVGALSIWAGVLTMVSPVQSAIAWMWVLGGFALVFGVVMLVLGIGLLRTAPSSHSRTRLTPEA